MPTYEQLLHARKRRSRRTRARVRGVEIAPRLSIFRSNRHVFAQLIDDASGKTLANASDLEIQKEAKGTKSAKSVSRSEHASWVGQRIAERALEKKITQARFDRGAYRYHGIVKSVADAARKAGLKF